MERSLRRSFAVDISPKPTGGIYIEAYVDVHRLSRKSFRWATHYWELDGPLGSRRDYKHKTGKATTEMSAVAKGAASVGL